MPQPPPPPLADTAKCDKLALCQIDRHTDRHCCRCGLCQRLRCRCYFASSSLSTIVMSSIFNIAPPTHTHTHVLRRLLPCYSKQPPRHVCRCQCVYCVLVCFPCCVNNFCSHFLAFPRWKYPWLWGWCWWRWRRRRGSIWKFIIIFLR